MKENNIIKQNVTILSIQILDFTTEDKSKICGYKVYYSRDLSEQEKVNCFGSKIESIFITSTDLSEVSKYKLQNYPLKATIDFEFVSFSRKPKPIKIVI